MACSNHITLHYCVCYPHPMSCLWHSGLVGRLASICHAPLPHPHLNSSHSHATMGMRVFLATWGQVCPSNSECGAWRCTPTLGGRGVEADFSPTLSQPVMSAERFSWQKTHTTALTTRCRRYVWRSFFLPATFALLGREGWPPARPGRGTA